MDLTPQLQTALKELQSANQALEADEENQELFRSFLQAQTNLRELLLNATRTGAVLITDKDRETRIVRSVGHFISGITLLYSSDRNAKVRYDNVGLVSALEIKWVEEASQPASA